MREAILGSVGHVIPVRQGPGDPFAALPQLEWPRFAEGELVSLRHSQAVSRVPGSLGQSAEIHGSRQPIVLRLDGMHRLTPNDLALVSESPAA